MNPHATAWQAIQPLLLGPVCEVTTKTPWGFKEDAPHIENQCWREFKDGPLDETFGTIILHILLGEGMPFSVFADIYRHACDRALKVIILEHNPTSQDWADHDSVTHDKVAALTGLLHAGRLCNGTGEVHHQLLGHRNFIYTVSTVAPLEVWAMNDAYLKKWLPKRWEDHAAWAPSGIYTHSSETVIPATVLEALPAYVPKYWVIGGLAILANINRMDRGAHHLIDATLMQVFYARMALETKNVAQLDRKLSHIVPDVHDWRRRVLNAPMVAGPNCWWRNMVRLYGVEDVLPRIASIRHLPLDELHVERSFVYTSTVPRQHFQHLEADNWVVQSLAPVRDVPTLAAPVR